MENILNNFSRIYFCGILGVSMSGLAKNYALQGKIVGGSDENIDVDNALSIYGVKVYHGHSEKNVQEFSPDVFVYTSAVKDDNPELLYAKKMGISIFKRSEVLGHIVSGYPIRIGVSGSHGKTTATAMIAKCLIDGKKSPKVFLGGESLQFGNFFNGKGQIALCEACEYNKNFLDIPVNYAVVLNVDNDHKECYDGETDLINTFNEFIKSSVTIVNVDDKNVSRLNLSNAVTFGINNSAVYMAKRIKYNGIGYSFSVFRNGVAKTRINLCVSGYHNVYNALSACAVCDMQGVSWRVIKSSLESFKGVKRRMERLGTWNGLDFIADYAHHPNEIKATVHALNEQGEKYLLIFQPHTYSRTKLLLNEFVDVLSRVENLMVYKTYPARENENQGVNAQTLAKKISENIKINVICAETSAQLHEKLLNNTKGVKKVVFVGAGDIYEIAKKILKNL